MTKALGTFPPRGGKVLIVQARIPHNVLGGGHDRPGKLDSSWSSLDSSLRAARPSEVGTLISVRQVFGHISIRVYDVKRKLLVATYSVEDFPDFEFGRHGQIDIIEFVERMPMR